MNKIDLRKANMENKDMVVAVDFRLNELEHIEQKREEKIIKAIINEQCFLILENKQTVGFILFDYRFFDQGWIELIILEEAYRNRGIGGQAIDLIGKQCKTNKLFTSTNSSNIPMQKALNKIGFSFAGKLEGLDEGDPELFYYKVLRVED